MEITQDKTSRRLGIFAIVFFILAFIWPINSISIRSGLGIIFPNIYFLDGPMLSGIAKFALFFPLVGAILAVVALRQKHTNVRIVLYALLAIIPHLLQWISSVPNAHMTVNGMNLLDIPGYDLTGCLDGFGLSGLIFGIALATLIAVYFILKSEREVKFLPIIALGAGILFLLGLIFPYPRYNWFFSSLTILLVYPFELMGSNFVMGLFALVAMSGAVAMAVFSIIWGIKHKSGYLPQKAYQISLRALLIGTIAATFFSFLLFGFDAKVEFMIAAASITWKMLFFTIGPFLAKICLMLLLIPRLSGASAWAEGQANALIDAVNQANTESEQQGKTKEETPEQTTNSENNAQESASDAENSTVEASEPVDIPPKTIENRIKELNQLKEKSLITEEEYQAKRKSILDDI